MTASATDRRGQFDDYYASLLQQLCEHESLVGSDSRAIGLTGCAQRSGVTTVAKHLAIYAAGVLDRPVLLVDANVTHPSMQETFGTNGSPGMVEVLSGQAFPLECVQSSSIDNLSLLTIGSTNQWNWGAFESEPLAHFLSAIHEEFGFIVFDLPAAHEFAQCQTLATKLDGVVLVVEAEKVKAEVSQWAAHNMQQAGANLMGVVFNKRRLHIPNWLYHAL